MPRRRERFERSDVPRASTHRSVIGAVVCVAVFAAIAAVVVFLWNRVTLESLESCHAQKISDWGTIKSRVKTNLSGYLYKTTKRSPMIIPVITEV